MVENPYCATLPDQLRYWDATALRAGMECPRKLQLAQNEGWQRKGNLDIDFGKRYHEACEMFDKLLLAGVSQADATWQTFKHAVTSTACVETLGTSYLPVWQCTSPAWVPQKRDPEKQSRNAKRCEFAKAPQYDGHRQGEACTCGLPTIDDWQTILSGEPRSAQKNRDTLLRTILFYCDTTDERVLAWKFPDGRPAVELSFSLPLPLESPDGTPYVLCGNMDGLVNFAGEVVPRERKTTKNTPGLYFFDKYAPDVQIDTYDLAAYVLYSDLLDPKPHGVMVEVTQVTAGFSHIERQIINIPEERREEWLREVQVWIKTFEGYAKANFYPKNTAACGMNGGCQFREICRLSPSARERFLPGERFERRETRWNPAQTR